MKLAVNYSQEVESLVHKNVVDFDYFKCPDFSVELIDHAKQLKPCYVHFNVNVGSGQLDRVDWNHILQLREQTKIPYVNAHAVAFARDYQDMDILVIRGSKYNYR